MMQHLTFNIGGRVRHETLEGRKYLVAPVAMLAEGVVVGSDGPLFYPEVEIRKDAQQWNHKPIVINHPTEGSACDPVFLEAAKVGILMRTVWNRKLRSEAWLDVERLEKLAKPVADAIGASKMVEVSTGLYVDVEAKDGTFKNKAYKGVAKNYRPDHLAILPDKTGAYSISDGGGLLQLNEEYPDEVEELIRNTVTQTLQTVGISPESFLNKESSMAKKEMVDGLITNKATKWEEADRAFLMGLEEKQLAKFEPTVVKNEGDDDPTKKTKEREQEVKDAATKGGIGVTPPVVNKENDPPKEEPKPELKKPVTVNEYVSSAPPEIQAMLNHGLGAYNAEKQRLIGIITSNTANVFSKEQLAVKEVPELHALAMLAQSALPASAPPATGGYQPSYYGAAGGAPTQNAAVEEPMMAPTMNFEKKEEAVAA